MTWLFATQFAMYAVGMLIGWLWCDARHRMAHRSRVASMLHQAIRKRVLNAVAKLQATEPAVNSPTDIVCRFAEDVITSLEEERNDG